jgi:hypothetical protein
MVKKALAICALMLTAMSATGCGLSEVNTADQNLGQTAESIADDISNISESESVENADEIKAIISDSFNNMLDRNLSLCHTSVIHSSFTFGY